MAKEAKKENKNNNENKKFLKEFKAELKRVSWPTFKQLVNNTGAVLAIVITVAVIVFVLDVIFENLNNFGVEKLKALVTSSSHVTDESGDESTGENSEEGNQSEVSNEAGTEVEETSDEASKTEETTNTVENGESSEEQNN